MHSPIMSCKQRLFILECRLISFKQRQQLLDRAMSSDRGMTVANPQGVFILRRYKREHQQICHLRTYISLSKGFPYRKPIPTLLRHSKGYNSLKYVGGRKLSVNHYTMS